MKNKNLQISLEVFEGPFDLLLKLINKNKINIYDIPIAKLTEQYINSIKTLKTQNMEEISEFLVMAATLLEIKSKMLLPITKQEDENTEDPREELVEKLIEYQKIKSISNLLKERVKESGDIVFKPKEEELIKKLVDIHHNPSDFLENIDLNILYEIFKDTLKRKDLKIDKIRSGFNSVKKPLYNIKNKIQYIKDLLTLNSTVNVNLLFKQSRCKSEILVTFLAILEIVKEKEILIKQDEVFSDIFLTRR